MIKLAGESTTATAAAAVAAAAAQMDLGKQIVRF
jgi:hypothetical protein